MVESPLPIRDYLQNLTCEQYSPAYFLVKKDGTLAELGGELENYGLAELRKGVNVEEQAFFMTGILTPGDSKTVLACIEVKPDVFADIHIFSVDEGFWVLLLDATSKAKQQFVIQQKANELSLLRDRMSGILDQHIGKDIAQQLVEGVLKIKAGGERKVVTILCIDIRGFTPYSERTPPEKVFETLNLHLETVIHHVMEHSGMVDNIMGDGVLAIFGLIASSESPEKQAVNAGLAIGDSIRRINEARKMKNLVALHVGIGITTGTVVLGVLGGKERKTVSVIGSHVNMASRLQDQARPGEILTDRGTYSRLGDIQKRFTKTSLWLKGALEETEVFVCSPK